MPWGSCNCCPPLARNKRKSCAWDSPAHDFFDPEYNIQLGSLYLSGLVEAYGTPEAALAAYNAGENRVAQWQAGQNYEEIAEFVESIPFNETRDYVQIVSRNAELYRNIYGRAQAAASQPSTDRGR